MRLQSISVFALMGLSACGFEPETPVFVATLSEKTLPALVEGEIANPEVAAARLEGQLTVLFGSLQHPGYYLPDDWVEEERDPNDAWWELSDGSVDAVRAGNEERFAPQLRALAAAEGVTGAQPIALPRPLRAVQAWARWGDRFEPLILGETALTDLHPDSPTEEDASEDDPSFTWGDEAQSFWRSYYPLLEESAELYRTRCLMCHGATGAGDGPTGRYLDPRPRDLRDGIFKWTGVEANRRPRRDDLVKVLRRGVRGTAMPSFELLSRAELEGLVDWVRYLAVRGETEQLTTFFAAADGDLRLESANRAYDTVWSRWDDAAEQGATVPDAVPGRGGVDPAMVARGAELFRGELANCASCHGASGEGDGDAIWEIAEDDTRSRRLDRWGQPSLPRNLEAGVFRGGDRPADLYRRIKYGIGGTIMPAADASLTDDDVWSLVYFVLSLSDSRGGD